MIRSRALPVALLVVAAGCSGSTDHVAGPPQWEACRTSAAAKARVQADLDEGLSFGVPGTPTFFINGTEQFGLPRAPDSLESQVEAALQIAQQSNIPAADYYQQAVLNGPGAAIPVVGAPTRGAAAAFVTIVEYSDFQCPFCRAAEDSIQAVLAAHPDDVRLVYKQFPLVDLHENAMPASLASVCAGEQGKFWEMHDLLIRGDLTDAALAGYATQLGLQ